MLGPAYRLFYEEPLAPIRGDDVWLFDEQGRRFLDAYNNVPVVGHCHPRVVKAMVQQASMLNTHTRYLHDSVLRYGERLTAKFPAELNTVMFTCTGSEANDLALRITSAATGGTGFIVTDHAYHGVTSMLAGMSPSLQSTVGPNVRTVPSPAALKGLSPAQACATFSANLERAIVDLHRSGHRLAALVVDTVFSSDGIYVGPDGLLGAAAKTVRAHGGLFIADEVQGGFGRGGAHWWSFQRDTVVPDIVTLGKPMGNGHPVGGAVMRLDLAQAFAARGRYFNTFAGNPVSAAIGMAVLDVIEEKSLLDNAQRVGEYLIHALRTLQQRHPAVVEVRGSGLYCGVELASSGPDGSSMPATALASAVMNALRRDGILIGVCGRHANVLKVRPPLTFSAEHVDILAHGLDRALSTASL